MQTDRINWAWLVTLTLFYLGLGVQVWLFFQDVSDIRDYQVVEDLPAEFEGNDWVVWKDTEGAL